jgi:hypothetical protein
MLAHLEVLTAQRVSMGEGPWDGARVAKKIPRKMVTDWGTKASIRVQFLVRLAMLMLNIQIRIGALVRRPNSPLLSHDGSDRADVRH